MDVAPRIWTPAEQELWRRIEAHAFEKAGIALDPTRRLARNMGWPLATARAAIGEYRRFCFLAMVSTTGPVTPSEEVDEVWHLHLAYTRDYWERWCAVALGRRLHHDPTVGGPAEAARYRAQYAETLALYESWFGPPPEAFWPGTAQRFAAAPRYRQVDARRVLVLPRPRLPRVPLLAGLLGVIGATVSAKAVALETTPNVLDWPGEPFLALYIVLLVLAASTALLLGEAVRAKGRAVDGGDLDPVAIAYLAKGGGHAADTLVLEMAVAGRARIGDREIRLDQNPHGAPDRLQPYGALASGRYPRSQLLEIFADSARAAAIHADLERRALFQSRRRNAATTAATLAPMAAVLCPGVAKLAVGLSRGRPVEFLVLLLLFGAIATHKLLSRSGRLTQAGVQLVHDLRFGRERAVRAPLRSELPLAFAVAGSAVLAGSDFSAYAAQATPAGGGSTGCGSSDSGGGGGDGGGCGGCSS